MTKKQRAHKWQGREKERKNRSTRHRRAEAARAATRASHVCDKAAARKTTSCAKGNAGQTHDNRRTNGNTYDKCRTSVGQAATRRAEPPAAPPARVRTAAATHRGWNPPTTVDQRCAKLRCADSPLRKTMVAQNHGVPALATVQLSRPPLNSARRPATRDCPRAGCGSPTVEKANDPPAMESGITTP